MKQENVNMMKNRLDLAKKNAAKTVMIDKMALLDSQMQDSFLL